MKIDVWSDFSCPFCYIGKRNLDAALELFAHKEQVKVHFRSFELDPTAAKDSEVDLFDILAKKFQSTREQVIQMNQALAKKAEEVGLQFNFDKVVPTNTFDAHRLFFLAQQQGLGYAMLEKLFQAYFTDGLHIGDKQVLMGLAEQVGLERNEVDGLLQSEQYAAEVRKDEQQAQHIGVSGVPFFVFNDSYAISGALPVEMFLEALEKCWEE